MKVTSKTITTSATKDTENAKFLLEYIVINGSLSRITATIHELLPDEHGNDKYIGNIYVENGMINSSVTSNAKMTPIFEDFEVIMEEVRNSIEE